MTRAQFLLLVLCFVCGRSLEARKKSKSKTPQLEVAEAAARRYSDRIDLDVRVRNIGDQPVRGLKLFIEFTDIDERVLTRQTMEIEDDELPAEDDYHFAGQIQPHARAVYFRIYFEDKGENEVLATKTGPFAIE